VTQIVSHENTVTQISTQVITHSTKATLSSASTSGAQGDPTPLRPAAVASTTQGNQQTNKPKPAQKSTNVGAIAGGVVGGVGALALIGAGIGYMILKKRRDRVEPMREISTGFYTSNSNVDSPR